MSFFRYAQKKMMSITTKTLGEMYLKMRQRQQSPISPSVFSVWCSLFSCFILHAINSFHFCSSRHLITIFFRLHLVSVYRRYRCCCLCMQALPSFFPFVHIVCSRANSFRFSHFSTISFAFPLPLSVVR